MKKLLAFVLAMVLALSLAACVPSKDKTNNPPADVVIEVISGIPNISDCKAVTEKNDPNGQLGKQGGYSGAVFFTENSITSVTGADTIAKGTDGGGCIEIYPTVSEANKRNNYLTTFDGGAFSSGSHKVVGTLIIRTSNQLTASKQGELEKALIDALKNGTVNSKVVATGANKTTEGTTTEPSKKDDSIDKPKGDRSESGFNQKTNKTISFHGIDFSFPSYFDGLSDDSTEINKMFYPIKTDYSANLEFSCIDFSGTQEKFNSQIPKMVDNIMGSIPYKNAKILKSEKTIIAGMSGWTLTFIINDEGNVAPGSYSFVYNISVKKIISILCGYDSKDKSNYDYSGDYIKILENAVLQK